MNIALPALLIFLLVLPGLIFNFAFYKIDTVLAYISLTNKTIFGSLVTLLLHTLALFFLIDVLRVSLDLHPLLILVSGVQNNTAVIASLVPHQLIFAAWYLLIICLMAYLFGILLRWLIVDKYKLDRYSFFEIDSPWYYLFKGYAWKDGMPGGVQIAAIIEVAGKGYLYVGILKKFFLDTNGNIDRLILTGAMRREIGKDKNKRATEENGPEDEEKRFYSIDGDYFVLRYSEVKNLNVQFFKIDEISK